MEYRCEFLVGDNVVYTRYLSFIPHVNMCFEIQGNTLKIKEVVYVIESSTVRLECKVL